MIKDSSFEVFIQLGSHTNQMDWRTATTSLQGMPLSAMPEQSWEYEELEDLDSYLL